jgi:hypothetical protein
MRSRGAVRRPPGGRRSPGPVRCLAFVLLALLHGGAGAHQLREVVTTIAWNPRAGSLEVVHRLHVHEAVEALAQRFGLRSPDPGSLRNQARAVLYVEERFALAVEGRPLALAPVGAELDGPYLFVYQESLQGAPPRALEVESAVLMERYPDLRHQVNYEAGDRIATVVLRPGAEAGILRLPPVEPAAATAP